MWMSQSERYDAIYRLETPVKCPHCGETLTSLRAIRLLRDQVNFTSTLPRRGRVVACPSCQAILPGELTNL
jgi:predicted  nucleic acid-binding Zn-ribbon protein